MHHLFRTIVIPAILVLALTGCESTSKVSQEVHPGKQTYTKYCFTCHAAGVADAPTFGIAEEWVEVLAKNREELLQTTKTGIPPGMPVNGLCMSCTDQQLLDAIDYMLEAVTPHEQGI